LPIQVKRLIAILVLCSAPSWATWNLLSSAQVTVGPNGTTSAIDTSTSGPATLLVACLDCFENSNPSNFCSISDNKNNGWTSTGNDLVQGTMRFEMFYSSSPLVGTSHTFTTTGNVGGVATYGFQIGAFTGALTSSNPFDKTSTAQSASASTLAAGSITPSVTNELLIACIQSGGGGSAWTNGSLTINNGTIVYQNRLQGAVVYNNGFAWYSDPASSAINQTFSWTTASDAIDGVMSFQPSAGAAAATTPSTMHLMGSGG
jgi:hypothetical protein